MVDCGKRRKTVHDFPDDYVKSLLWASPELLEQNLSGYDTKSDIYSLGITACELANGCVPFSDMPATQMLLEKLDGTVPRLLDRTTIPEMETEMDGEPGENDCEKGIPPPYDRMFSQHFHNFVSLCLQSEPMTRPSASELLQHPFLRPVKRKSGADSLPELLHPVSPLTSVANLPTAADDEVDGLARQLEDVDITEPWDFTEAS